MSMSLPSTSVASIPPFLIGRSNSLFAFPWVFDINNLVLLPPIKNMMLNCSGPPLAPRKAISIYPLDTVTFFSITSSSNMHSSLSTHCVSVSELKSGP